MRAEVGLLSRNVVFRGDPETSAKNQFGGHIMIHSKGDESCIGRIEYIELRDVGQAFQLGRYPIHFHLIGTVHKSYVRGNAIHHTYNRAVTIHAVHFLRIINNVAYKTMGHTFFIEDAVETKNLIEHNLAINTQRSWSLLNSDQFPASFWITHPDNIFRGNHAAGAENYGFWFDPKPTSTGPSYDPNICPENSPLGEFTNNVAHSNGKYGLRIFHKLIPRTNPCLPLIYDPTNETDHYWQNPLITARFQNLTSWKNKVNGAIGTDMGDIRFENFKVSDNLVAGIEFEMTKNVEDGRCQINGALVVGRSENAEADTNKYFSHGIITPRTENFQVHNVSFYNFDIAGKAAIGSCSHCWFPPSTDSGARTITFSNLYFDKSVLIKIRYQEPFRDIFYDLDGTLTGLGPNTWATPYFEHNVVPECKVDLDVYDGIICDSSVQVRRVVFYNFQPVEVLVMMDLKVIQYDDEIIGQMDNTTLQNYLLNSTKYSRVEFTPKQDPENSWAVPFVTGHKYKVHWQYGLDFMRMQTTLSERWQPADRNLFLTFNFTDLRQRVDFTVNGGELVQNGTLVTKTMDQLQAGDNIVYNHTAVRQIHMVLNGKNTSRSDVIMNGLRCVGSCFDTILPNQTLSLNTTVVVTQKLWSNPMTWPSQKVPKEGEDVMIDVNDYIIFDLVESPIYRYIQINGVLEFKQSAPKLHLRARYINVRAGEFRIGNQSNPYLGQATITLYGDKEDEQIAFDNDIEAGNKILANTAKIRFFGVRRSQMGRLTQTAQPNDTSIYVTPGLDWQAGDRIALSTTTMMWYEIDQMFITSYNADTGELVLDEPLSYYHWGQAQSTGPQYSGVDMRGEVLLLTRNIKIQGNDTDAWGCQVVTSDFIEANGVWRNGSTIMDSVEIYNCSQYDTQKAAIRFEATGKSWSHISNCAVHNGLGIGSDMLSTASVMIQNSTFFTFKKFGINIEFSRNITIDGNIVIGIYARNYNNSIMGDVQGNINACGALDIDFCWDIKVINNIAAGLQMAMVDANGFTIYGHECDNYTNIVFKNNTAHSIEGNGAVIFRNENWESHKKCVEASFFTAYKCTMTGIVSYTFTDEIRFTNMILIDNTYSAVPLIGQFGDDQWVKLRNMRFDGETPAIDCPEQNHCYSPGAPYPLKNCFDRSAIMLSGFSRVGKPAMIKVQPSVPQYKIKSDGSFGGQVLYENTTFTDFKSDLTYCGSDQRLFRINPFSADYIPLTRSINTKFNNVDQDAMVYLFSPPNEWTNTDDCGEFPCTAPNNVLLRFEKSTFSGQITPINTDSNFQIISGNDPNSKTMKSCQKYVPWNAYYCTNDNIGILLFESLDGDLLTRLFSPVILVNMNTTGRNMLNTMMDHLWDGFYTSQKRLSRFPALVDMSYANTVYEITYTGTPPGNQRFSLRQDWGSMIIRIRYPKAGSYVIKDYRGVTVKANDWDKILQAPALLKADNGGFCGENRYVGVSNVMEFYLKKGCNITIVPIDSIQTQIRLNWTLDSFYSDGGTTKFVDRMAASLGIKASNIKVVSVYMGSVVVQFQVIDDSEGTIKKAGGVQAVQQVLTQKLSSGKVDLGAPVLSFSVTTVVPAATAVTSTNTQSSASTVTPTTTTNSPVTTPSKTPSKSITVTRTPLVINKTVVMTNTEGSVSDQNSSQIIVITIIVVIVFLIALTSIAYYLYKRNSIRVPQIQQIDIISVESPSSKQLESVNEVYEEQYHPDFLFGRKDVFKSKFNQADDLAEMESEENKDDDQDLNKRQQTDEQDPQSVLHTLNRSRHEDAPLNQTRTQNSISKLTGVSAMLDEELGMKTSMQDNDGGIMRANAGPINTFSE